MSFRQIKVRKPDGTVVYEEVGTIEDMVAIALAAVADGVSNPRLDSFVVFIAKLGRIPTETEFDEWLNSIGGRTVPMDGQIEPHEN